MGINLTICKSFDFRKTVVSTFRDTARKLEQTVDMSAQTNVHKKIDSIWKVTAKDVPVMVGF